MIALPLPRLCGPKSEADKAESIRREAVRHALAGGASPADVLAKIEECFFHARPWIDGVAGAALGRMTKKT